MAAASPTTMLGVYRGLLRQSQRLVVREAREDRSLRSAVDSTVRKEFREPVAAEDLKARQQLAFDNYFYLERLLSNDLAKEGRGAVPQVSPDMVSKAEKLLSSPSQRKISQRKWGFFDRLFS